MLDCAAELWQDIFERACTDGGTTGCSLALVSKSVHQASAPFRYYSVMLEGTNQLSAFVRVLENSDRAPNVRHLFVCDIHSMHSPPTDSSPIMSDIGVMRLSQLLSAVSYSLETLTLNHYGVRRFTLPSILLPMLKELNIHGDHFGYMDEEIAVFPKLTRLNFEGWMLCTLPSAEIAFRFLHTFSTNAPLLADLVASSSSVFAWWTHALPSLVSDPSAPSSTAELFPMLRSFFVQLEPLTPWKGLADEDLELYRKHERARAAQSLPTERHAIKFGILDPPPHGTGRYRQGKMHWLAGLA